MYSRSWVWVWELQLGLQRSSVRMSSTYLFLRRWRTRSYTNSQHFDRHCDHCLRRTCKQWYCHMRFPASDNQQCIQQWTFSQWLLIRRMCPAGRHRYRFRVELNQFRVRLWRRIVSQRRCHCRFSCHRWTDRPGFTLPWVWLVVAKTRSSRCPSVL